MYANAGAPVQEDLRTKEWSECRTTIGRLDTILADLRKFGFSLVTTLLTASGIVATLKGGGALAGGTAAAFVSIMVLVAALFAVDTYYQVLLRAAVERAIVLEAQERRLDLSRNLKVEADGSAASFVTVGLYLLLLATAAGLGLLAAGGLGLGLWAQGPSGLARLVATGLAPTSGKLWLAVVAAVALVTPWTRRGPRWLPRTLASILAVGVFGGPVGIAWLASARARGGAAAWILFLATFLAVGMTIYWVWVQWRWPVHPGPADPNPPR